MVSLSLSLSRALSLSPPPSISLARDLSLNTHKHTHTHTCAAVVGLATDEFRFYRKSYVGLSEQKKEILKLEVLGRRVLVGVLG